MADPQLPDEIARLLRSGLSKRARIVIEHILRRGYITTEELESEYGYKHPPRAARDVREAGIPLETFTVTVSDGRSIAAYKFGDLSQVRRRRLAGRRTFPRKFKDNLYESGGGRCTICSDYMESRYLQIDHRVPYEVAGDEGNLAVENFMLLCGSCNRAKSWSCEHCTNWLHDKSPEVCAACYWANPLGYVHVALREVRRLDIVWEEDEVHSYEHLRRLADERKITLAEYVKQVVALYLDSKSSR